MAQEMGKEEGGVLSDVGDLDTSFGFRLRRDFFFFFQVGIKNTTSGVRCLHTVPAKKCNGVGVTCHVQLRLPTAFLVRGTYYRVLF